MTRSIAMARRARAAGLAAAAVLLAACHGNPAAPPPPERLVVSAASLVTTEGGTGASFDVVLASTPAATVEVEVRSGDPTEGLVFAGGYAGPAVARELGFTPQDWNVPRRVVVQPVDDATADGNVSYPMSLHVSYSEDAAYVAVPRTEIRVTNLDDDTAAITIVPVGGAPLRTDEAGATAAFEIWLASAPTAYVQIPVVVGDTTEGLISSPYYTSHATVMFTAADWHVPQTITVTGQADGFTDGEQRYAITVGPAYGDPTYAALPAQTVQVFNADLP